MSQLEAFPYSVCLQDFVIGLSVLSRGSIHDKLKWTFSLYDVNADGVISKDDLSRIIISIYDLMGKAVDPVVDEATYKDHIDKVFTVGVLCSLFASLITI